MEIQFSKTYISCLVLFSFAIGEAFILYFQELSVVSQLPLLVVSFVILVSSFFLYKMYHINKATLEELNNFAFEDSLTATLNRRAIENVISEMMIRSRRDDTKFAVIFLDLDNFKMINDTLGHKYGDAVLVECANRLKSCIREGDRIGRFGGDEFIILLDRLTQSDTLSITASRIQKAFLQSIVIESEILNVSFSMGASIYPDNAMTIDSLFSTADMAMYQVKEQGKNGFQFYDASLNEKLQYSILMEKELKRALDNSEFELMYQPKYIIAKHSIYEAEALIRWRHPEKGILMPSEFLSFAEKNGLIKEIGAWVVDETCRQCRYLLDKGMQTRISVNVSAKQLRANNFVSQVRASIEKYKIDANLLEFEISEAIIMDNLSHLTPIIKALKALHVKIAVDGFGKAFSSLGYMNRLPIDTIKIDKNLLNELSINDNNRELIAMMIAFGHAKNMNVITEGVEVEKLFNLSRELKADQAQGYYFSKPKDIDELIVYYQNSEAVSA